MIDKTHSLFFVAYAWQKYKINAIIPNFLEIIDKKVFLHAEIRFF